MDMVSYVRVQPCLYLSPRKYMTIHCLEYYHKWPKLREVGEGVKEFEEAEPKYRFEVPRLALYLSKGCYAAGTLDLGAINALRRVYPPRVAWIQKEDSKTKNGYIDRAFEKK